MANMTDWIKPVLKWLELQFIGIWTSSIMQIALRVHIAVFASEDLYTINITCWTL